MKAIYVTICIALIARITTPCFSQETDSLSRGQNISSIVIAVDLPFVENGHTNQDIKIFTDKKLEGELRLVLYKYTSKDSSILFDVYKQEVSFKKGAGVERVKLFKEGKIGAYNNLFFEVLKKFNEVPPGLYGYKFSFTSKDKQIQLTKHITHIVDSTLPVTSALRTNTNDYLAQSPKADRLLKPVNLHKNVSLLSQKVEKKTAKKEGVKISPIVKNGQSFMAYTYKGWFLGQYKIEAKEKLKARILKEQKQVKNSSFSLVDNDLSSFSGLTPEFKSLNRKKEEQQEKYYGNISLGGHFGNGQDPGSGQDNNYQDIAAEVHTKILGMPVMIEGYYTSQDRNRIAKASYIRLHYDIEEAKDELNGTIHSYKSKYNELKSSGTSATGVYQNYLQQLIANKSKLTDQVAQQYGIALDENEYSDYALSVLVDSLASRSNDSGYIQKNKEEIIQSYKRLRSIQQNIRKYKTLLEQYETNIFFDSALVYEKVNQYANKDNVSYRQLLKSAKHILPEGKTNNFIAGLTNLDIGIINQYQSKYTISGQTIKGGSLGYDFGFVKATVVAGQTEYISRTGSLDRYNSYLLGLDVPEFNKQNIGFQYYVYTPTRQILESSNFKSDATAIPTFKRPVHITSLHYRGQLSKNISLETEGAASFKQNSKNQDLSKDNTAISVSAEYNITKVKTSLSAGWEHIGAYFENNSLPYMRAATERYELAGKKFFFKSFLLVGVQFNYFKQAAFASTGYNKKWGFDVATKSKRYPNVKVSYKPYTTFRTFNDTFSVAQRPLIGEVWLANGTYQLKRNHIIHRFLLLYNKNSSQQDSIGYQTNTFQAAYFLNYSQLFYSIAIGWMQLPNLGNAAWDTESYFTTNTVSYAFNPQVMSNISLSLAMGRSELQRWALGLGCSYRFKKFPLTVRTNGRYASIQTPMLAQQSQLLMGDLVLTWQFKASDYKKLIKQKN